MLKRCLLPFFFLLVLTSGLLTAQPPEARDRGEGEEEQIEQRIHWFRERRGLDTMPAAERVRAEAAISARRTLSGRGVEQWEAMGPASMTMFSWAMGRVAGRITAIAVHPANDDEIYVGTAAGGVWHTTNGGAAWTPVFDQVGTQSIGSVIFDPFDPTTVWVGTGDLGAGCGYFGMGLFRSSDGGATWEPRNGPSGQSLDLSFVSGIAIFRDAQNQRILLAGGKADCTASGGQLPGGLFRSADDGATWTRVHTGTVWDVVVGKGNPATLFMTASLSGTGSGVFSSTDGGLVWKPLNVGSPVPFSTATSRARLSEVSADGADLMYAFLPSQSGGSIYRTSDGGTSWAQPAINACEGQCSYNAVIAVRPDLGSTLLVGTIRIAKSISSGAGPVALTATWGSTQQVHQDTHVITYSRSTPGRFWVGSDGGIWRSDNDGATFVNLNANLNITQFYDIAVHPSDMAMVFGGAQDNSSSRRAASPLWDATLVTGDGFMNIVDAGNPSLVFQTSYPSGGLPSLAKSSSGGNPGSFSWMARSGLVTGEPYPWVTPLAGTAGYIFLGSHSVYRAPTNQSPGTFTWTKISGQIATNALESISAADCGGQVRLFALGSRGEVQRTDDALGKATFLTLDNVPTGLNTTDIALIYPNVKEEFPGYVIKAIHKKCPPIHRKNQAKNKINRPTYFSSK